MPVSDMTAMWLKTGESSQASKPDQGWRSVEPSGPYIRKAHTSSKGVNLMKVFLFMLCPFVYTHFPIIELSAAKTAGSEKLRQTYR
ncbi:MAG: hypothetical protein JSU94_04795 [Phycisphaerales bacterium]|nr:MAG: hypothetical protein JSU94_04795 [Phycisphaerales bacterium]